MIILYMKSKQISVNIVVFALFCLVIHQRKKVGFEKEVERWDFYVKFEFKSFLF